MADTIISNTPGSTNDSGGAGTLVTLVVILAVIIGGIVLYRNGFFNGQPNKNTEINVTIPTPTTPTPAPAQ